MTSAEIEEATGISNKCLRDNLRKGIRQGLVTVSKAPRTDIAGTTRRVPVYKVK